MLPRKNRLNIRREFAVLKKTGRMVNSESFGFLFSKGEFSKLNFIVSTKISNKAVDRNLIKRRLREIVRQMLPEFEKKNVRGVFLVKKAAVSKTYQELKNEVKIIVNEIF